MLRVIIGIWTYFMLLRRLLLAHLMVVNEGSPTPEAAFPIADVTLSQAFYSRVAVGAADYYRFTAAADTPLRMSMLVPENHHTAGFRTTITLTGPGLPPSGLVLPAGDAGKRFGTTVYRRTHQAGIDLTGGSYLIEIRGSSTGVYCFCVGTREPDEYADAATRTRVHELLALAPGA
jgi:hypothetical protein